MRNTLQHGCGNVVLWEQLRIINWKHLLPDVTQVGCKLLHSQSQENPCIQMGVLVSLRLGALCGDRWQCQSTSWDICKFISSFIYNYSLKGLCEMGLHLHAEVQT